MRFNFKSTQINSENNDHKPQVNLTILSYKTAYNRLIRYINENYWKLTSVKLDFLDKSLQEDKEVMTLQLDFCLPEKKGAICDGSASSGKRRLIEFLRTAYIIQAYTLPEEGCLPLLHMIEGFLASKKGHHFPGQLAKAVVKDLLKPISLKSYETTVNLTGELAVKGQQIIDQLNFQGGKRYNKYCPDNSGVCSDDFLITTAALM